ncbi:MAG: hypothetical protein LV479_04630 [Methylacidiphilales bacterium]|nr:hypothetical protein [Candidatus Methylacidiphilales bacterium]
MKAGFFLAVAMMALVLGRAPAQTPAPTADPAKIADFEKRFAQGQELEQEGKLEEARTVFDGIIAESPEAKGSLREAGFISVRLGELEKADGYFEKLHALVPDYPAALESLIQINQSLRRDVKVERFLKEFRDLHASEKNSDFSHSLYFVRERIHAGDQQIIVTEFFDFMQQPNTVWMAELFDAGGHLKRRILLNYDPDATEALHQRDPKYASTQVFTWFEHKLKNEQPVEIVAYVQIFALPDYAKFRSAMLSILADTPKPIYTQAIGGSGSGQ